MRFVSCSIIFITTNYTIVIINTVMNVSTSCICYILAFSWQILQLTAVEFPTTPNFHEYSPATVATGADQWISYTD